MLKRILPVVVLALGAGSVQAGYEQHPAAAAFVARMEAEGFDRGELMDLLRRAERQQSILDAIARPAERVKSWGEYRKIFIQPRRIEEGVAFWRKHEAAISRAAETYGVAPEIIVAIIGVETHYGRITGRYRVLDALATLAFDYPPRGEFFAGQLRELLLLAREEKIDPTALTGSYAGAMGYGQFIPGSYRSYAVDFDGDGRRDIINNVTDAIGSVANYFARHGWQTGGAVAVRAEVAVGVDEELFSTGLKPQRTVAEWRALGIVPAIRVDETLPATAMRLRINDGFEYWLGLPNFYVITRYNHSALYAMAVWQLSQAILKAKNTAS